MKQHWTYLVQGWHLLDHAFRIAAAGRVIQHAVPNSTVADFRWARTRLLIQRYATEDRRGRNKQFGQRKRRARHTLAGLGRPAPPALADQQQGDRLGIDRPDDGLDGGNGDDVCQGTPPPSLEPSSPVRPRPTTPTPAAPHLGAAPGPYPTPDATPVRPAEDGLTAKLTEARTQLRDINHKFNAVKVDKATLTHEKAVLQLDNAALQREVWDLQRQVQQRDDQLNRITAITAEMRI